MSHSGVARSGFLLPHSDNTDIRKVPGRYWWLQPKAIASTVSP